MKLRITATLTPPSAATSDDPISCPRRTSEIPILPLEGGGLHHLVVHLWNVRPEIVAVVLATLLVSYALAPVSDGAVG